MIKNVRNNASAFYQKFGITEITEESLCAAIKQQGYTVIHFNKILNNSNVEQIINNLNLKDYILCHNGFTYANDKYRLVFVNDELSEDEKIMVLAHEEGHIFCGHMNNQPVLGLDVRQEYEANEFAHYLLHPSIKEQLRLWLKKHKKAAISIFVCLLLVAMGFTLLSVISKEKSYYGEYYVTATGNKYHKKDCIYVKNKNNIHRLTQEEFDSGEYEACKSCLPND